MFVYQESQTKKFTGILIIFLLFLPALSFAKLKSDNHIFLNNDRVENICRSGKGSLTSPGYLGSVDKKFPVETKIRIDNSGEIEIDKKVDSVLSRMTLKEKIGQLSLFSREESIMDSASLKRNMEDIKNGRVGGIFNSLTSKNNRELQRIAVEETRLGIPLLFGFDVIHGYKTIFPIPLGEAATWDLEAVERSARIAAVEATAAGLNWTYAPMVDIARDPRWGRIAEGAGEDPYLGAEIAKVRVRGFQGNDLSASNTLMACAKHFAAYGAAQAGRDYHTVDISDRTLREVYLIPFKAAVDAGVSTFMTSFNELNGVPATGNHYLLTEILRNEWGFGGFVTTDYTSINEMVHHGTVKNEKEAGELAINAGADMDTQGGVFYNYLEKSVKEGKVKESVINQAVRRILTMKFKLGLFDDPYKYCVPGREKELIFTEEHLNFAREIARKSIVLLKNENHTLPLDKNLKTITVIGPLAADKKELIGCWYAAGDYNRSVSLLEGIKARVSNGTKVLYAEGCKINETSTEGFNEALKLARMADMVIITVGEEALMSGEAASRSILDLPGVQLDLVKTLHKTGKPVIVVLMNGRPLTIPWIAENVPALIETWFLGTQAGNAIADILFGDYNPSGKLPVTFPRNVGQIPVFYNMKNTGRPLSKNKYTSKYLDVPNSPLFPFGFGLSYTSFEYGDIDLDKKILNKTDSLKVSINIKNTGNREGEEVVQLYIRDLVGSVTRPVKELKGFKKINLKPGESKEVIFYLSFNDLAFYDRDMNFVTEPGDFEMYIGTNSVDVKTNRFSVIE